MKTETITWRELPQDGIPDAELTVLLEVRDPDQPGATECWPGFWSGERWIDCSTGWPIGAERVVAWADVPAGSLAC
jgi:hypothetical protein